MKNLVSKKSPWVYRLSQGTCNGCELEILSARAARFDLERLGVLFVDSPRHADIVLLTGCGTKKAAEKAHRLFDQVPKPKVAVQIGACAINGGIFKCTGSRIDGAIKVEGCPPRPGQIIAGIKKALEVLESS